MDWWQTILLTLGSLAMGGLISLVSARFQHRWSMEAAELAEMRAGVRQYRKERMLPVVEFVDACRKALTAESLQASLDQAARYTSMLTGLGEDNLKEKLAGFSTDSSRHDLLKAVLMASPAAIARAPTVNIADALGKLEDTVSPPGEPAERLIRLVEIVQDLDQMIEDYVVRV